MIPSATWRPSCEAGMKLPERILNRITAVSITAKTLGMVTGVVFILGVAVMLQVRARLERELRADLETRGVAIARSLATRSTDPLQAGNDSVLRQLIRDTLENNPDVSYAFILDAGGEVAAHSFNQSVPPDLLKVNMLDGAQSYQAQTLQSEEGPITDIAVPILDGKSGLARLGLSHQRLEASVARITWELVGVMAAVLALGLGAAYVLTRLFTRPLLALVETAQAVSRGDMQAKAPWYMGDEIGELAASFNAMTADLDRSHAELLRRMSELSALDATATAISVGQRLGEVLQTALDKVLGIMDLQAGWIFLNGEEPQSALRLAARSGLSAAFAGEEATRDLGQCVCNRVLQEGRALIVRDICAECASLSPDLIRSEGLVTHASVPLAAGGRVLGVMNTASSQAREFTPDDLTLLSVVGRQLGIAIENARLWEEVKEKETLRQHFLERVIAAQETERQRLARELHDEAAQTLTALSLGLRRLQDDPNLSLPQRKLAGDLKSQTTALASDLHRLAVELRPSALDRVGLIGALGQYVQEFKRRYSLEAQFESDNLEHIRLSPEIETSLYRIVQEALTNVARHAQARSVSVLLQARDGQIVATVEDDGKGFDPAQVQAKGRLGLFGMQERAAMLGGSLNIESAPGQGTTVFVKIPLSLS